MAKSSRLMLSLGLPLLVVGGIIGAEHLQQERYASEPATMALILPKAGFGPADQQRASAESKRHLELARAIVARDQKSWLARQVLSRALSQSYNVDGDYEALVEAGRQLSQGRQSAVAGSGPNLVSAEWAMSVHDLDLARRSLDGYDAQVVKLSRSEDAAAAALRGDLAFYSGDMQSARRIYDRAAAFETGPGVLVRQATIAKAEGNFDKAIALLVDAGKVDSLRTPQSLANLAIQIGAIEFARGRYRDAGNWYARAEKLLPGYWKTRLYHGEAALLAGRTKEAIAEFKRVVDHNGAPEAMDALAMIYRHQGDRRNSLQWAARAQDAWATRIEELPSAALAHAAEHELAFGDPRRALELARRNVTARPYGEARILYAKALNANGRYAEARSELSKAQKSGWQSALLFIELARSEEALGGTTAANEARKKAVELNPEILSPQSALVWFAHG